MDHRSLMRNLVGRVAVDNYAKEKDINLRIVHVNLLLVLRIHGEVGMTSNQIYILMKKLRRGSNLHRLNIQLDDLVKMDMVAKGQYGRVRKWYLKADGIITLNDAEKAIREARIDRRKI